MAEGRGMARPVTPAELVRPLPFLPPLHFRSTTATDRGNNSFSSKPHQVQARLVGRGLFT